MSRSTLVTITTFYFSLSVSGSFNIITSPFELKHFEVIFALVANLLFGLFSKLPETWNINQATYRLDKFTP